jgi:folate-binding protein YgfZ
MANQLLLHEAHARLGAHFGEADGHLVPLDYGDIAGEHGAVRGRVGVIDRSYRGKVAVTGRDRAAFLNGMLSNDVKTLTPGQGCAAALLDPHGKIVSLLTVHYLGDRLVLEMDRRLVEPTLGGLDRYLISERVEFEDVSSREGLLTVAGPTARATVEKALETTAPEPPAYHHISVAVDGRDVRVVRGGETGDEEYDLWVPAEGLARMWERLGGLGAQAVGREAWNILRIEAGVVWHGVDVDATTLLLEAPLERTYSLTKGCYVGQEVVARITYRGHVNRKVVGFRFPDRRVAAVGDRVLVDAKEIGRITSATVSPALGRGIALGFIRREHWEPGTAVDVVGDGRALRAEVAALPFYPPPREA